MLFLNPTLAQTRDYSRSNYTCTHFLIYDTRGLKVSVLGGNRGVSSKEHYRNIQKARLGKVIPRDWYIEFFRIGLWKI